MAVDGEKREPRWSRALPDVDEAEGVVPEAYVWPREELGNDEDADCEGVPLVDLGVVDGARRGEVCERIRAACGDWGFFQVVNHGVGAAVVDRADAAARRFFGLPLATKELLECRLESDRLLGYGFFQSNRLKPCLRLWSEGLYVDSPHITPFAATVWPQDHAEFSEAMEEYVGAMRDLGVRFVGLIMESLGVSDAEAAGLRPKEPALVRLNHYPPCPNPSLATGLVPHHDANLLTILHQGDVGGLQVWRDGRWHAVRPQRGAFAINAGNMLQVISNDMCRSALHRAVVNKHEDRYSMAYFVQAPNWDHVAPLPELVDDENPAKYRPFTWSEYLTYQQVQDRPANALEFFGVK